jgi:transcriptional regulator with XRE-family HTH domain
MGRGQLQVTKRPNAVDAAVGKRVRMRRLMLDMSQTDLADGLAITFQQVQKYEKGSNRISASRLQQISNILRIPVSFFFEGVSPSPGQGAPRGAKSIPEPVSQLLDTAQGHALIRAFNRINDQKVRDSVVELVEAIADDVA